MGSSPINRRLIFCMPRKMAADQPQKFVAVRISREEKEIKGDLPY